MLEDFRLDRAGVRELLRGQNVRRLIDGVAEQVAAHVRAAVPAGTRIDVSPYTTDRGAAAVAVLDVRAMAWQAKHGTLTRAAGAAGLEVKAWQR
ncbi:hypothetical protein [Streptomyces syringium]|uniref:hypothetical protein n=1 Tax=Streptomyces syringium TaxID=76729 RepID=UPI00345241ED